MLLRRTRFGFRLRRQNLSSRLLQGIVVVSVLSLFSYIIFFALRSGKEVGGADFSWLESRNMSFYVRSQDTTLIKPSNQVCGPNHDNIWGEKLRLLIVVNSAPDNFENRGIIRKTWGKSVKEFPGVRLIFMLGLPPSNGDTSTGIRKESEINDDIVQHDFIENYVNLTVKTGYMLKWTLQNCLNAKFLFKVDDDTFVNPKELWKSLDHAWLHTTTSSSLEHFIKRPGNNSGRIENIDYLFMGNVRMSVPVRDRQNKYYLPSKFYPLNILPKFLCGPGYIMSSSIVPMLYQCLLRTPFMNLEDVFISGLCGTTQMGLRLSHNPSFRCSKPSMGPNYVCYYKNSVIIHGLTLTEMEAMWVKSLEDQNCDTFYFLIIQILDDFVGLIKKLFRI